ncbi:MAG: DUF3098 domain-containing protein [Bacteroidetes bacterium]|jgi:hypothetical protein|nr:MAG: DUF3098 domain-containing protein [Bacteroidota bacterium]|tara:strand:+ start:1520 stop:1753 length:234 start_codon:yes stop_codon:yes gene_type:complete
MQKQSFVFEKKNYLLMAVGIVFMIIGYLLMQGGGSEDPTVFNEEIFNARRITWAPLMLIIGLVIEVYAIMASNSSNG